MIEMVGEEKEARQAGTDIRRQRAVVLAFGVSARCFQFRVARSAMAMRQKVGPGVPTWLW